MRMLAARKAPIGLAPARLVTTAVHRAHRSAAPARNRDTACRLLIPSAPHDKVQHVRRATQVVHPSSHVAMRHARRRQHIPAASGTPALLAPDPRMVGACVIGVNIGAKLRANLVHSSAIVTGRFFQLAAATAYSLRLQCAGADLGYFRTDVCPVPPCATRYARTAAAKAPARLCFSMQHNHMLRMARSSAGHQRCTC